MAELIASPEFRGQFIALSRLRWQTLFNSLRSTRGSLELFSRVFIGLLYAVFGVGGAFGLGAAAAYFASQGKVEFLAFLFWPVFLFWQLFPVMATAFAEGITSSHLLRFPLTFPSFFFISVTYGLLDPITLVSELWLAGIAIGVGVVRPSLFAATALILFLFAIFNILLSRMLFAWIERWLAQRRTREIMGVIFFLLLLSAQFIGPLIAHYNERSSRQIGLVVSQISPVQRVLPPGATAAAIAQISSGQWLAALAYTAGLCGYVLATGWLLAIRLRAEYGGEKLSESAPRVKIHTGVRKLQKGWDVFGLPAPLAAIFEKEIRYIARSGPLLFTMIVPLVMLLLFRLGPGKLGSLGPHMAHTADLAFPIGAGYVLLLLTNISYNALGGDGSGVQFFFAAPVEFRTVIFGKNLAYTAITLLQIFVIWLAVCFLYYPPSLSILFTTIAALLFAWPIEFSAANLLSLYSPKRVEYGAFGRQRPPQTTALASIVIHAVIFGVIALVVFATRMVGKFWIAALVFLLLAALALPLYLFILKRMDGISSDRREDLISELSRVRV